MVETIRQTKDKVLQYMERELGKYGGERMDVKQMGELADIVKDLAQAEKYCWESEYYRLVSEAMGGGHDEYAMTQDQTETINSMRELLSKVNPEMRTQIRGMIGM